MLLTFKQKVLAFASVHYKRVPSEKIKKSQFSMCNSACHFNAVAAVNSGRADKVFLCIANGVVHFINYKDGFYFDETWPYSEGGNQYYIIREVGKSEFDEDVIYGLLCDTKRMFINMFGSAWQKYKCNVKNEIHRDL